MQDYCVPGLCRELPTSFQERRALYLRMRQEIVEKQDEASTSNTNEHVDHIDDSTETPTDERVEGSAAPRAPMAPQMTSTANLTQDYIIKQLFVHYPRLDRVIDFC